MRRAGELHGYNQVAMSRSHRQIMPASPLPHPASSSAFPQPRPRSLQNRNFGQLLQRGRQLYNSNQLSQAVDCFQRGLYYDPSHPELNFSLAVAHLALDAPAPALRCLSLLLHAHPKYKPQTHLLLAIAHSKMGDPAAALQAATHFLTAKPLDTEGLFLRAKLYLQRKDYALAVQDLDALLAKEGRHLAGLLMKVRCLGAMGRWEEALGVVREGLAAVGEGEGGQTQLRMQEAKALMQLGRYSEGLSCLSGEGEGEAGLVRGKMLMQAGRAQEAVMLYNEILSRNATAQVYCEAIAELAIYYMRERDFYEAFAYLRRTQLMRVRSKPTDQLLKLAEGVTFLMKKKYAEAILLVGAAQLQFAHSLAGHSPFLLNLHANALAFAHFSLANHQAALTLYRQIVRQDPSTDFTAASYNIAICEAILHYQGGKRQEALKSFQVAGSLIARPQPHFYTAVLLNESYLADSLNSDGFVRILEIIEKGLRTGESAHMYYYRAVIYLFLGMNAEALEDVDRAIEKSEDNVGKYFHARGVIFMLDRNFEQAVVQFTTALSIDDRNPLASLEKAKCQLLGGDPQAAHATLEGLPQQQLWSAYFHLHEKNYSYILDAEEESLPEGLLQVCHFMCGQFERAGPSGKLLIAILYENYSEVVALIEEAVVLGVSVGCLQTNDLLVLKAYSEYRLGRHQEAILTLLRVQRFLRDANAKTETYSEEDERKLLLCKVDVILVNFSRDHQLEALQLTQELLGEVCEGPIADELLRLKSFLVGRSQGGGEEHEVNFSFDSDMISDYFAAEQHSGLRFKFLIPLPNYRVPEVEMPQYEVLLTGFKVADIENKPEAPWIRRGQFGVIFTNDVQEYANLNLRTEENEAVRSKMPTERSRSRVQTRSRLMAQLKLSSAVLDKLERLAHRAKE